MNGPPKSGVIGWPIGHSRSPVIHGFWLERHGIAGSYDRLPVAPHDLPAFVRAMKAEGFVGANVTIPHKAAAAALCDRLSPTSQRLGVVNTLWFEDGVLCGDTTDGLGFLHALDQEAPDWDRSRNRALVIGAGGAARSIVDALATRGFAEIVVANRSPERALALAQDLGCRAVPMDEVNAMLPTVDLLVNTTAAGMSGQGDLDLDLTRLPPHAVVDDIVYVPKVTRLLAQADGRGLRTVGGLGMLLHQAVPGFERWFGVRPEVVPALRARVEADILACEHDRHRPHGFDRHGQEHHGLAVH